MGTNVVVTINGKKYKTNNTLLAWVLGLPILLLILSMLWLVTGTVLVAAAVAVVVLPVLIGIDTVKALVARGTRRR